MRCVVILLGPPGAGKGTQAARLGKDLALAHISTGDLFRDNLSRGTELGRQAKTYMDSGRLVPDAAPRPRVRGFSRSDGRRSDPEQQIRGRDRCQQPAGRP